MRGAVYHAVRNPKYVELAAQSARSLKRHMPGLPITLFTDLPDCKFIKRRLFDAVERLPPVPESHCANQMLALRETPYDATLCLDSDTWVCADLSGIFEAVEDDRLDFLAAMVQQYRYVYKLDWIFEEAGVPSLFPRYCSGVMALAKNHRTDTFLERWSEHYEKLAPRWKMGPICPNQPSLRVALYQSPLVRMAPLNACYEYLLYAYLNRPVKIIHWKGNEKELREWEREVNKHPKAPRYMQAGRCIDWIDQ